MFMEGYFGVIPLAGSDNGGFGWQPYVVIVGDLLAFSERWMDYGVVLWGDFGSLRPLERFINFLYAEIEKEPQWACPTSG